MAIWKKVVSGKGKRLAHSNTAKSQSGCCEGGEREEKEEPVRARERELEGPGSSGEPF